MRLFKKKKCLIDFSRTEITIFYFLFLKGAGGEGRRGKNTMILIGQTGSVTSFGYDDDVELNVLGCRLTY